MPDGVAPAVERAQTLARRAGGAWNRHDRAAVHDSLVVAMMVGLPDVKLEYGGLRFRFDLPGKAKDDAGKVGEEVVPVAGGGERMDTDAISLSASAAAPVNPATSAPATANFADSSLGATSVGAAAELERLRERAATAQAAKRRQKTARKARAAAERESLAAYTTQSYGGVEAPTRSVRATLWSQHIDLKEGMIKLVGEVTHRCGTVGGQASLSTKACQVLFAGQPYEMTVLSGTVASKMTSTERAIDMLMLLSHDPTEERLTVFLRRWSKRAASA